ncbi:hypothetical protein [Alsobacter sp. SYSU BS001988]
MSSWSCTKSIPQVSLAWAADVVEVLERVGRQVGLPRMIRVDQGTEFVFADLSLDKAMLQDVFHSAVHSVG